MSQTEFEGEVRIYFSEACGAERASMGGDEWTMDGHLAELAALTVHAKSPTVRANAARIVAKFRYEERLAEREAIQISRLSSELDNAISSRNLSRIFTLTEELEGAASEAADASNAAAARWLLARHAARVGRMTARQAV